MKSSTEPTDHIDHIATVVSVDPATHTAKVRIKADDDCGSCPAARLCKAASGKGNTVEIHPADTAGLRPGQNVTVRGTEMMHRRAIMLATVIPSILLVAAMTVIFLLTGSQPAAALGGVGVMIFFFTLLYLLRNRIAHEFTFKIIS